MQHKRPKLLAKVRRAVRLKHYGYRTEQAYVQWIRRYTLFRRHYDLDPRTGPGRGGGT
ncbi:MAG: phage integrase N-terminal SAM-like domain-containing protein [Longimicrobiaceae bacterium]